MKTLEMPVNHRIVPRDEWTAARKALLAEEKELTRRRDTLARRRRELPWVRVEKGYAFDTPTGTKTLAELFAGRSQLIVYHFMFGRSGRKDARAARSSAITSMARSRTSRPAT